jgi:voltage-gated sodium channel
MIAFCKRITEASWVSYFIFGVIIAAGVVVGLQTYKEFEAEHHMLLSFLDTIILGVFALEVLIKIIAEGKTPWRYFLDPWNVFDFTIVAVCLLPIQNNEFVAVLRLARVLRVMKLVSAIPRLQILVGAVLKSIPSIGYVSILAMLLFYIYGCMGTFIFSENDPAHFRNLQISMLSLFQALTLEDWADLMYINMYGSANYGYDDATYAALANIGIEKSSIISKESPIVACLFFLSFIVTGAMVVLNLFIGVVLSGMEEAKKDQVLDDALKRRNSSDIDIKEEILMMEDQLKEMSEKLSQNLLILSKRVKENSDNINKITDDG